MAPNPHIRNIRMLQPEIDLGNVDRAKGARRSISKKRPKHPAEGLLDADELDVEIPPEDAQEIPPVSQTPPVSGAPAAEPEVFASSGDLPEVPSESAGDDVEASERFSSHVIGEAPEEISDDFPEPIDI